MNSSYLKLKFHTNRNIFTFLVLFLVALIIYGISYQGEGKHWNYFILLADAFIHGRLYLTDNPAWLNELITFNNKFYVVYPPMPAILLIPFIYVFGTAFPQPVLSIIIGSLNVGLSYLVFWKFFHKQNLAIWLSLLFGFGTMHWYHTEVGSAWYIAHIIAIFFIWLSLLELLTKQRLWLIGLLIGAAYLSRLPAILAVVFVVSYLNSSKINVKNLFMLGGGLLVGLLINWSYNYLRFGTIEDISYRLLPIFNEPWYKNGLFSIYNIPIHLQEIFTALPIFSNQPPFIIPSLNVLALWFVTPALLLIPLANFRSKLTSILLITIIVMSLPGLAHGSNGFTQFGFRFALDYTPFLILLVGSVMNSKYENLGKWLICLSILINLWGVVMISILKMGTI